MHIEQFCVRECCCSPYFDLSFLIDLDSQNHSRSPSLRFVKSSLPKIVANIWPSANSTIYNQHIIFHSSQLYAIVHNSIIMSITLHFFFNNNYTDLIIIIILPIYE